MADIRDANPGLASLQQGLGPNNQENDCCRKDGNKCAANAIQMLVAGDSSIR